MTRIDVDRRHAVKVVILFAKQQQRRLRRDRDLDFVGDRQAAAADKGPFGRHDFHCTSHARLLGGRQEREYGDILLDDLPPLVRQRLLQAAFGGGGS